MHKNRRVHMICMFIAGCFVTACAQNIEVQQNQEEALRAVGEAYMVEGKYREALRSLLDANRLYPEDPYLHNDIGLVYLAMEKPGLAVDHFKLALDIRPDYAPARNNLGKAYADSGNLDAAIACFKEVSENLLYATPHYPMLNLGEAYYMKKEYKAAETYYQKALNHYRDGYPKDATYVKALRGLGRARLATGNIKDGIAALERAIRLAPRFEPLYLDLAAAYKMQGEYEKALNTYRRLIRMAPDSRFSEEAVKAADQLKKQMGN